MQIEDKYGADWTCSVAETIGYWNAAIDNYLDFSGSPVGDIQEIKDPAFLAGPAFCAAMKLFSGMDPQSSTVQKNLQDMRSALTGGAEDGHARAVEFMIIGEPSAAAREWDEVLQKRPYDILAHKCSHEAWFLVGKVRDMLGSTTKALNRLNIDDPCFSVVAAQHGFALEENESYEKAESWARLAINIAPRDCWALHCLAYVYETQNRHSDSMSLLNAKQPIWKEQNLFNGHIWWHLALRLIEAQEFDDAIAVFDDTLVETPSSNQFRLTDGISLLWRLELQGVDVGERWKLMADKWGDLAENHQNAFLDLHGALAFAHCADHGAADTFFQSLLSAFEGNTSELVDIYKSVALPLINAIRMYPNSKTEAAKAFKPLLKDLHKIGGSVVQRELVERSYSSALIATGQINTAEEFLNSKIEKHPNTPWLLRERAAVATKDGNLVDATLFNRRADAMFASWS